MVTYVKRYRLFTFFFVLVIQLMNFIILTLTLYRWCSYSLVLNLVCMVKDSEFLDIISVLFKLQAIWGFQRVCDDLTQAASRNFDSVKSNEFNKENREIAEEVY